MSAAKPHIILLILLALPAQAGNRAPIKDHAGKTQGYLVEKGDGRVTVEDKDGRERGEARLPFAQERVDPRSITDPAERHYRETLDTIMGRPWSRK